MDEQPDPDDCGANQQFVERLVPLLRAVSGRLDRHLMDATATVGLPPPVAMALRALEPRRPRPMSGLAEMLRCDPSNVTGIADRLESQGLAVRQPALHDRRVKELAVTPKGSAVRERFLRELGRVPLRIDTLDPGERATLVDLLGRLLGGAPACDGDATDPREATAERSDGRPRP